jgi:hypothetical protein
MLRRLGPTHLLTGRAKVSGCCCLVGDDLGHRPMITEYPGLARRHVSGGDGLLDLLPSAMSGETDHGPNSGAGAAGLAGGVRICGGADRNASSGRRVSRQRSRAVTPVADRLGPLIALPLEPVPNRAAGIGSGEHGHDGGDPQLGQSVRMCGVVGRRIDREAALDGSGDEAPVLDGDRVITEDGLMGEGDRVLAAVGGDELLEESAVVCGPPRGSRLRRRCADTWGPGTDAQLRTWASGFSSLCSQRPRLGALLHVELDRKCFLGFARIPVTRKADVLLN